MPKFTRDDIKQNQSYLDTWDDYQLAWLNDENANPNRPLLLPVFVNISNGIIDRDRIKVNALAPLMIDIFANLDDPLIVNGDEFTMEDIHQHYKKGFPKDVQQSGTPSTPLDMNFNGAVLALFHLSRENWAFTRHTQFSVDNICKTQQDDAFTVLGTFNDGHSLAVLCKNWTPKGEETFRMKYNLHVSITQKIDNRTCRTDIIIDPGTNNDSTRGGGGSGGPEDN